MESTLQLTMYASILAPLTYALIIPMTLFFFSLSQSLGFSHLSSIHGGSTISEAQKAMAIKKSTKRRGNVENGAKIRRKRKMARSNQQVGQFLDLRRDLFSVVIFVWFPLRGVGFGGSGFGQSKG